MSKLLSYSSMGLILKEWLYAKKRIIPIMLGFSIFSVVTILMLKALPYLVDLPMEIFPEFDATFYVSNYMSNAKTIFGIITVILCADAIAGEREKNTLIFLQTKPLKSSIVITTKALMRFLLVTLGTIVSSIVVFVLITILTDVPDIELFLLANLVMIILLFTFVSIGVFISTFVGSQLAAGAISVGVLFGIDIITSFLTDPNLVPYNSFQLAVNILYHDITPLTIFLNCLFLIGLGILLLSIATIRYYSEKEPTRR